jgi:hypothetical protein
MIDAGATFVALFVTALVYHAVQRRELISRWGDVRYGVLVMIARVSLEALSRRQPNARSWNPNVLVLTGAPSRRWHLVVIGRALAGDNGLLTIATVLADTDGVREGRVDSLRQSIETHLEGQNIPALVKVETDRDVGDGLIALVKSYGFGPLVPNTVLIGKAETPDDPLKHAELLSVVQQRHKNLIVVHEAEGLPVLTRARRIELWWRGHQGNIGLMLALGFLLKRQAVWADAEITIWRIVGDQAEVQPVVEELAQLLANARFSARTQVIVERGDPFDAIERHSRGADLLFLGLRPRGEGESLADYAEYYAGLARRTEGLPPTALVAAGEAVDLHRLFAGF